MAIDPRNLLRRAPSKPTTPATTSGEKKAPAQNQAAAPAPAQAATPAQGKAQAPATQAPPTGSPANQAAATQQRDLFAASSKPASKSGTTTLQTPLNTGHHVGGGNFFDDLFTDLFATSRHRSPKDRTNLSQYAADAWGKPIPVSSNDDDPFAKETNIEGMHRTDFDVDKKGNPVGLRGNRAGVIEEDKIFRKDAQGNFVPFAWNPWPKEVKPDANGRFVFDEPRFPLFQQERGPDGKIIVKDGLQVWTPNNLSIGSATTFEGMNSVSRAAESWAGREIDWGNNGKLEAEPHTFIDFNAFYSPSARQLFFGVVPYRLKGETQVKMFETATSWDMVAHESGHAIHNALMPDVDHTDPGFNQWGESFGDQTAMWTSLKDRDRASALLTEINGDPNKSNSLTRIGEAFASLIGSGTGIRDAFQDLKISNTSDEVHDRSQVLTGASYKIFQAVYQDQIAHGRSQLDALQVAGDVMGTFNARSTEHVPANSMSLEDVGKAWLKVDKEYFKGKYSNVISTEMQRREIFDAGSVAEFKAHESALPKLSMGFHKNDDDLNKLIKNNLSKLGIGPGFDLQVTDHELDDNGAQIVRVQLRQLPGKGQEPIPLGNNGILTFRPDGSLMDYQSPLPPGATTKDLGPVLSAAREAGLDQHGVPVGVRRKEDGSLTAVAQYMPPGNMSAQVSSWTLENPDGETVTVEHTHDAKELMALLPPGAEILSPEEIAHLNEQAAIAPGEPAPGPVAEAPASPFVAPPAEEPVVQPFIDFTTPAPAMDFAPLPAADEKKKAE
ncbi:MAG TPA: hypothetical protein VIG99_21965 [Myxococcaceae bacterium]